MSTQELLERARAASLSASDLSVKQINTALKAMADSLIAHTDAILAANATDMEAARGHLSDVMLDRLSLTEERIAAMAEGVLSVAALPSPLGRTLSRLVRPNGLVIRKVSVPLGVVAIIYESRPNVTSDAAALCIKSGNVCVLRSGKDAFSSSNAVAAALREGLAGHAVV